MTAGNDWLFNSRLMHRWNTELDHFLYGVGKFDFLLLQILRGHASVRVNLPRTRFARGKCHSELVRVTIKLTKADCFRCPCFYFHFALLFSILYEFRLNVRPALIDFRRSINTHVRIDIFSKRKLGSHKYK